MNTEEIQAALAQHLVDADIHIQSDDGHHFYAQIVWSGFVGKNPVARQRLVYSALGDAIQTGAVHALSLKTLTPEEWASKQQEDSI